MAKASLRKRIKLNPGGTLWGIRESITALNTRQLEDIMRVYLADTNVKFTRHKSNPSAVGNFRVGFVAGVFLCLSLRQNREEGLTSKEKCISQLTKLLFTEEDLCDESVTLPNNDTGASAQPESV